MTRRALALAFLGSGLGPRLMPGQQRPEFEVASVKPVDISKLGDAIAMNIGAVRREEVTFGNATLRDCIRFAYNMASDAQIEAPDWVKSKRFLYDIVAKGPPGSTREQLQTMTRTLLAERFRLSTHRERKQMQYYALVVARGGPKISSVREVPDGFRNSTQGGKINGILPMSALAYLLSRFETERSIVDATGLNGMYGIQLQWALRPLQNRNKDPDDQGPSLFTALEEQLGLRLEARRGPVDILVVDSAEKVPVEN